MCTSGLTDSDIIELLSDSGDEDLFFDDSDDDPDYVQQEFQHNLDSDSENEEIVANQTIIDSIQPIPVTSTSRTKVSRPTDSEIVWTNMDSTPTLDVFNGFSGVTNSFEPDENSSVLDFFSHFVDSNLIDTFKQQTNLYARQRLRQLRSSQSLKPNSRMNEWKCVTLVEIKKFIAIIFHQSISQRPQIIDHWSKDPVVACTYCPNIMSRNRFLLILSNFHINDNSSLKKGEPGYDPLHKVRPLIDTIQLRFQQAYLPGEKITIDEGMCAFRGRLQFKQYMPQKPSKYGIKLYMLSEADTGYVWNFSIYCGLSNVIINIVTSLLGSLSGVGRTLYTDRYYTSPDLARELENMRTALVGTVMKNRRGLPKDLKSPILERGEQIYRRAGNLLAICWRDKRPVYMLSTRHAAEMVSYRTNRGTDKTKPACVLDYNQNKAGVDRTDQLMSYGAFDHKTVKWWKKLAFHCLLMCVVNACILYNKVKGKKMAVTQFIKLLCTELPLCEEDSPRPSSSGGQLSRLSTGNHFIERIPAPPGKSRIQRMCKVCSVRGKKESGKAKRKDTSYWCSVCKIALCMEPCFKVYHSKKNFSTSV